jgi:DNA (cytosine-5)-methyltransferase 3A
LSIANAANHERRGLQGKDSRLFWDFVRCLNECRPRFFVLENVASMKRQDRDVITQALGVEPVLLDSSCLTAQRRRRLFWCNFHVPELDKRLADETAQLRDILESRAFVSQHADELAHNDRTLSYIFLEPVRLNGKLGKTRFETYGYYNDTDNAKAKCLTASCHLTAYNVLVDRRFQPPFVRKFSPRETERLQGFPDDYTAAVNTASKRYKLLGNAVTVPVIAYIMENLAAKLEDH